MAKESEPKPSSVRQKKSVSTARTLKPAARKASSRTSSVQKDAQSSVTKKKALATRRAARRSPKKTKPAETEGITMSLPKNMSIRAIEKSLVLMHEFERQFGKSIYQITYVTAICFILIGAAYSISNFVNPQFNQKAEVISSVGNIITVATDSESGTNSTDEKKAETIGKTTFSFFNSVPDNLVEPYTVSFEATNAEKVVASLSIASEFAGATIPIERVSGDKYKVVIPTKSLQPNYYILRITVKPLDGSTAFVRKTNDFFVGSEEVEKIFNDTVDKLGEADDSSDSTPSADDSTDASGATTDTQAAVATDDKNSSEEAPLVTTPDPAELLLISPPSTTLSGLSSIRIKAPNEVTYIELYARPANSISQRFVALATKRLGQWVFTFDSNDIPNGDYEFSAKTKYNEKTLISHSIRLTVNNVAVSAVEKTTTDILAVTTDRPLLTDDEPIDTSVPTLSDDVNRETTLLLKENESDLRALLERYAVAKQVGDESLIKTAQKELQAKRDSIALKTLQDERVSDISDKVNNELFNRIQDLQNRIDTFEEIRKQRSAGVTSVDSDDDGISDIDEVNLYGADPARADTDNDGVTDGIEIMRGYNPLDARPEAVIRFESPKETVGLVRQDVLEISEVLPLWGDDTSNKPLHVAAEIHGKGLPNSFVTLYIFSTPTVVTIKTDPDGTFVYTFDKELEDGQHEVFVTMTDNAGSIIAQSNPFSFIKEAQAFTPVLAETERVVSPAPVTENTAEGYSLAIGMGILSFGLILLMLGVSLRRGDRGEIVITEKPLIGTDQAKSETL